MIHGIKINEAKSLIFLKINTLIFIYLYKYVY